MIKIVTCLLALLGLLVAAPLHAADAVRRVGMLNYAHASDVRVATPCESLAISKDKILC